MKSWKGPLVAGAATLVVGLVVTLPARVVHGWFAPPALKLAGIEGTAWDGSATEATVGGAYLRNLSWSFRPLALFTGKLGYRLEAEPAGGFLETDVAVAATGNVNIATLRAALPLAVLQGALPLGDVSGNVTLSLANVELVDGWPTRIEGSAGVAGLLVRPLAPSPLGDFRAEFQTADGNVVGAVEDLRGMLDVVATLTLTPERGYALVGRVGPTASASDAVVSQLRFLGTADERGLREFRIEGSL